jgi:hypothetical protein
MRKKLASQPLDPLLEPEQEAFGAAMAAMPKAEKAAMVERLAALFLSKEKSEPASSESDSGPTSPT